MKVGLYFGSFNPIHTGHLIIASSILNLTDTDRIWFVVSPQNPFKNTSSLLNEYQRLHLVRLAIEDNPLFLACDIEFKLIKPSFTIHTLTYLREKYPKYDFRIIMGSDSYQNLPKWKNYEEIQKYQIFIYRRNNEAIFPRQQDRHITLQDIPQIDISSTTIREMIRERKSVRYLVPDKVMEAIQAGGYYKK